MMNARSGWGLLLALLLVLNSGGKAAGVQPGSPAAPELGSGQAKWQQVNANGFGNLYRQFGLSLAVFNNELYAGSANWSEGAQLWRSSDGENWELAMDGGFGNHLANPAILSLAVFNNQLFAGSGRGMQAGQLWRSENGATWSQVTGNGIGINIDAFGTLAVFNGKIYAATCAHPGGLGAAIWRSSSGASFSWERVVEGGLSSVQNSCISGMQVFDGYLYAAVANESGGAQIWRSASGNAGAWQAVRTGGFGDPANDQAGGLAVYGGRLYVGTRNANTGGQLWRSADGLSWESVKTDGFGDVNNLKLDALYAAGNSLYAGFSNPASGLEVWRSVDGLLWQQINLDGFGDSHNRQTLWSNEITLFQGRLYLGVGNEVEGAEIWRYQPALTLWAPYYEASQEMLALRAVISTTEAANPGLFIEALGLDFSQIYPQYAQAVAAGGGPDLMVAPNDELGNQVRAGLVLDISDLTDGRLADYQPTAVAGMSLNGRVYGVPESSKAVALFYRKSALSSPPATTAELLELARQGHVLAVDGNPYHLFGFWRAFGGRLMTDNGYCIAASGGFAAAMHYLLELKAEGAIFSNAQGADQAFLNGQADLLINGPWALGQYQAALGADLGVALLPAGPAGAAGPMLGIDGYTVNPNTADAALAVEAALLLTNAPASQLMSDLGRHIPVREDVVAGDALIQAFAQAGANGMPRPQIPALLNYWGTFQDMLVQTLAGNVSPEQGVATACRQMNAANGFPGPVFLPLARK